MPLSLGFNLFAVALVLFVVVTIALGVRTIPQGHVYTVERFGRYSRSLGAGIGLIIPYVEQIGRRVNVMEQVVEV
ncbi:MAG: SPFH/Band 7/PHB domain protein, partial [Caulobacteraceae bacterium]|nr:SPFH/Band 7/PHB domain protein [Caulobacter sp.]